MRRSPQEIEAGLSRLRKAIRHAMANRRETRVATPGTHEKPLHSFAGMRLLEHPRFVAWLERVRGVGFSHGHDLAESMLGPPWSGLYCCDVDDVLTEAELRGLIRKASEKPTPTRTQQFLGAGGLWWRNMKNKPELCPPRYWGWRPG